MPELLENLPLSFRYFIKFIEGQDFISFNLATVFGETTCGRNREASVDVDVASITRGVLVRGLRGLYFVFPTVRSLERFEDVSEFGTYTVPHVVLVPLGGCLGRDPGR